MSSRLKRDRARAKLAHLLSISNDQEFLQMIWCADRLRVGNYEVGARGFRDLPADFRQALAERRLFIMPWSLEDLVNELLTVPKPHIHLPRKLDCHSFQGFVNAYNAILAVDDTESGFELERGRDVLQTMPRLAHRQFEWQRGWMSAPVLYRCAFIYGQGDCESWFQEEHGLRPSELILFAMACVSVFSNSPFARQENLLVPKLRLDRRLVEAALLLMCASLEAAREEAAKLRRGGQNVAARPSVLRRTPMLAVTGRGVIAPLPDLLLERATAGLYLDLVKAPSGIRDYIGRRFEQYCFELFKAAFGDQVRGEYGYGSKSMPLKSPDILIGAPEQLKLIVECKATRMSFAARFSDDWHLETTRGYGELAKGVGQIWRHCSHMRRRIVPDRPSAELCGLLLTLDPWMRMTHNQEETVLSKARQWCAENDSEILKEDECPISFSHVGDIEDLLHRTSMDGVLKVLALSANRVGWGMAELGSEEAVEHIRRPYFFKDRLDEVLPWTTLLK